MVRFSVLLALLLSAVPAAAQSPAQRGSYLANSIMACGNCHTPKEKGAEIADKAYSGGQPFERPAFNVSASNITQHKETGIGNWSADDIKKALRTGVRPNGVALAPIMPTAFYGVLTTRDADALVAYLRTLKAVNNEVQAPLYRTPVKHHAWPGAEKPASSLRGKARLGFYLTTLGHCMECHTPMDEKGVSLAETALGKGGRVFKGPWGESTARNITSHKTAGLGGWSDAEIKRAITQGIRKDGSKLKPPMAYHYFARMTDKDVNAVVAYLRTLPPKE
jgi:mono/diheme cytochrome c family protein